MLTKLNEKSWDYPPRGAMIKFCEGSKQRDLCRNKGYERKLLSDSVYKNELIFMEELTGETSLAKYWT